MQISESVVFNFNKMCKTVFGCIGKIPCLAPCKQGFIMICVAENLGFPTNFDETLPYLI
jgi:hypothetical protein